MIIGHSSTNQWVEVVMQDGTRYSGYLDKVSVNQDGQERELFVKDAVRVPADGSDERRLHSVYIEGSSVVAVEFVE
jgi:small nuclear ribonucleoprotein (snRNP)-like protein